MLSACWARTASHRKAQMPKKKGKGKAKKVVEPFDQAVRKPDASSRLAGDRDYSASTSRACGSRRRY
jgi:hypothetical protein